MSTREAYYIIKGIAHQKGYDLGYLGYDLFASLYAGLLATKPRKYFDELRWIRFFLRYLMIKNTPPKCQEKCKWRMRFDGYNLQRNALRMELASLVHRWRCGWRLKDDCIGGHPLDYEDCYHSGI